MKFERKANSPSRGTGPNGPWSRFACVAIVALMASQALATWSIIIIDTQTKEIAIGSATCLTNFNLQRGLPVVLVDVGAGAAQSFIDQTGANRQTIWNELLRGTHPEAILARLKETDNGYQTRQYGIVDVRGRAITFSGTGDGSYANGLTGQFGTLAYAIQGNVITGQPVLDMARDAILNTPGGLPEKLMAAMEAARSMGGDGRCSCSAGQPDSCGSPPPSFTKAAHIGFMIVTRRGDVDGVCTKENGCANGAYYMTFNIKQQAVADPDPVFQLQSLFDEWRVTLIGEPDAVESTVRITPGTLPADGASQAEMMIDTLDWQQNPASDTTGVTVEHDAGSAGSCAIGPVNSLGGGRYSVTLTAGASAGVDRFKITATGTAPHILIPSPTLTLTAMPVSDGGRVVGAASGKTPPARVKP